MRIPLWTLGVALAAMTPVLAHAQTAPVLFDAAGLKLMATDAGRYPLFAAEVERTKKAVDKAMRAGILVPVPKDPGGGYTHEQHKRNYTALPGNTIRSDEKLGNVTDTAISRPDAAQALSTSVATPSPNSTELWLISA